MMCSMVLEVVGLCFLAWQPTPVTGARMTMLWYERNNTLWSLVSSGVEGQSQEAEPSFAMVGRLLLGTVMVLVGVCSFMGVFRYFEGASGEQSANLADSFTSTDA